MADGFKALPCMGRAFYMQFNAQISVMVAEGYYYSKPITVEDYEQKYL